MGSIQNHQDEEACLNAVLFCGAEVFPMVRNAAIELDLFGIIAKAGDGAYVSASEIASQLPTQNPEAPSMLDRMLRLFASHSFLSCSLQTLEDGSVERNYGLTPASRFLIGNKEEGNLCPLIALAHHRATVDVWLHMKDAILEGGNLFKKVHGISVFEYMNKDSTFNTIFNEAMAGNSTVIMNTILKTYKGFEGLASLVDVGGGTGQALNMIVSKYPSIKAINYDLPHVIQSAPPYPDIQHVGGDMFMNIPKGDAIMIKDTCHNWSDESIIKVLKNVYEVLPEKGKLIIITVMIPEAPETTKSSQYASILDNMMLTQAAGKQRTTKEFELLTKAAGFTNFSLPCATSVRVVIECYK